MSTTPEDILEIRRAQVLGELQRLRVQGRTQNVSTNLLQGQERVSAVEREAGRSALVEETPSPVLVGIGRSLVTTGRGLRQAVDLLRGNDEQFNAEVSQARNEKELFQILANRAPRADVARFTSNVAQALAVPGGAGTFGRAIVGGAVSGAAVGAGMEAESQQDKVDQLLFGMLGGGAGGTVSSTLVRLTGARGHTAMTQYRRMIDDIQRSGLVPDELVARARRLTTAGEALNDVDLMKIEGAIDNVPFWGAGHQRFEQFEVLEDMRNAFVERLGRPEGERVLRILRSNLEAGQEATTRAYNEVNRLAREQGNYPVSTSHYNSRAEELLQQERSAGALGDSELINILEDAATRPSLTFDEARILESRLFQKMNQLERAAMSGTTSRTSLGAVRQLRLALQGDLDAWAANGRQELQAAYAAAKQTFRDRVVPFRNRRVLQFLEADTLDVTNDPDSIARAFIRIGSNRPSAAGARQITRLMEYDTDPLKALILSDAIDNSMRDGVINPSMFARNIERMSKVNNIIFDPAEQRFLRGYVALSRTLNPAIPGQGNTLATLGQMGAGAMLPRMDRMIMTITGARWLLTTPSGRSILTSAARLPVGDKAMDSLVELAQIGIARSLTYETTTAGNNLMDTVGNARDVTIEALERGR